MEDTQIVELYWNRDQSAIVETKSKYSRILNRISMSILQSKEDSEECENDTYMKAWSSIPPQKPNCLIAYLGRITRNISINRWHENHAQKRGGNAELLSELTECIPSPVSVEAEVEANELTSVIVKWLNSLPQDDRVLFLRRYWFGESIGNLAGENLTTPNKLAGRMYRLREKLRATLEKEGCFVPE